MAHFCSGVPMVIYCRNSNTILHQHGSSFLLNFLHLGLNKNHRLFEFSQDAVLCSEASINALNRLHKLSFVQKIKFTIEIEHSAVLAVQDVQKHVSLHIETRIRVNSITQDWLKIRNTWILFRFAGWDCWNSKFKLGFCHELIWWCAELTQLNIITTKGQISHWQTLCPWHIW